MGREIDDSERVFRVPRTIVERLKEDCAWAKIEDKDASLTRRELSIMTATLPSKAKSVPPHCLPTLSSTP